MNRCTQCQFGFGQQPAEHACDVEELRASAAGGCGPHGPDGPILLANISTRTGSCVPSTYYAKSIPKGSAGRSLGRRRPATRVPQVRVVRALRRLRPESRYTPRQARQPHPILNPEFAVPARNRSGPQILPANARSSRPLVRALRKPRPDSAFFIFNSCFPRLMRIFGFALDTSSRQNQAAACFCTRLFVSLASPKILRLGKIANKFAFCSRLIRIFVFRWQNSLPNARSRGRSDSCC